MGIYNRPQRAIPARSPLPSAARYLDTRRDEFAQIGRSWSDLKAVADKVGGGC